MSWILAAILRWAALAGLYLVLAGDVSPSEIIAGLITGGVAAALSLLLRQVAYRPFDLRLPWARLLGQAAWSLARDIVRIQAALLRVLVVGCRGRMVRRRSGQPRGRAARAGHRAVEILILSIAPNAYVVDDDGPILRLHRLVNGREDRDEAEAT